MTRIFLSPPNWIGFERADFFFLALAAIALLLRIRLNPPGWYRTVASRPWVCGGLLFAFPIALRLALLKGHPEPVASGADDFGYLFLADTLRHFRLANPPNAFPAFFEQIFVLQRPTYSSMFNLGQGIVLAMGWMIAGHPWAGILFCTGALPPLTYWMLRAWVDPGWALAGGVIAGMTFGPLCYWTNCYWGGGLTACAGALVFGALPRFNRSARPGWALIVGTGLAISILTRPFETVLLILGMGVLLRSRGRYAALIAVPPLFAFGLVLVQNRQVTGSWITLPYQLYRYEYGVPATFTLERNPIPHTTLNSEQEADYRVETGVHGYARETISRYVKRLLLRVRFVRFFLFAPLFLSAATALRKAWRVGSVVLVFALGSNFYPYFYPHYVAAIACLFILLATLGMRELRGGPVLVLLCVAQFSFSYVTFASGRNTRGPNWDFLNGPDPQGRSTVASVLAGTPGKHIVFVHYSPEHQSGEWIHNWADVGLSPTIWVHDLGPVENREFLQRYPNRDAWILEPDFEPPVLRRYVIKDQVFVDVQ